MRFFITAALCLGLVFITTIPVWNINDFGMHFGAAWHRSNRMLGIADNEDYLLTMREGDAPVYRYIMIDPNVSFYSPAKRSYADVMDNLWKACDDNALVVTEFLSPRASGMSFYSLWNYVPYSVVFAIGRCLGMGLVSLLMGARCVAFLVYSGLIAHAIKRMPYEYGKWLMATVALLPLNMMNLTALSYDPVILTASFNLISLVLFFGTSGDADSGITKSNDKGMKKAALELMAWCFLLGAVKGGAYAVLVILLFAMAEKNNRKKTMRVLACMAVTCMTLVYYNYYKQIGEAPFFQFPEREGFFSAGYALRHIGLYMKMLIRSYLAQIGTILHTSISGNFGWNENLVPEYVSMGFVISVFLITFAMEKDTLQEVKSRQWKRRDVMLFVIVIAVVFFAVPLTVIYGVPVGSKTLSSLFGRYYVPVLFMGLMLIYHKVRSYCNMRIDAAAGLTGYLSMYMITIYFMMITYLMR